MIQVSSFGLVRRHYVLLFALWAFLFQSVAQSQTCYRPSQIFVGSPWTPCNASAEVSYCCSTDDVCLANGYCYGVYLGFLYRPSCTDRTWEDPSCPYYCADLETNIDSSLIVEAYADFWCCRSYNSTTSLCDYPTQGSSKPFQLANSMIIANRTTGQTLPNNTSGQSSSTTITHASKATVTVFPDPQHSNSNDIAIGLGVGIPLGVLLLLTTSLLLRQLQQQKKQSAKVAAMNNGVQNPSGHAVNYDPYLSKPELKGQSRNQVNSHPEVPELEAS